MTFFFLFPFSRIVQHPEETRRSPETGGRHARELPEPKEEDA
jgi:hypothetical protein